MNKYFKLTNEDGVFDGVIENIPEETSIETIKNRIETKTETETIELVEQSSDIFDIVFDWTSIDYEYEIDKNYMSIMDSLDAAKEEGLEIEVVYTALKSMKQNPQLSISEAIQLGMKEWVK